MVGSTASVDESLPAFGIGVGHGIFELVLCTGKIAWFMEDSSEDSEYSVYFDVLGGNYERVDYGTRAIGAGEPLICDDVVLNFGFRSTPAKDLLVGNHRGLLHLFRDDSTEGGRPALLPHETIKVLRG